MKNLKIIVEDIICYDPQDPKRDELYFVVATDTMSKVSKTIRRISEGKTSVNKIIFDEEVDENSPILITVAEQRGLKDESNAAKMMRNLAAQGVDYARYWMENNSITADDVWVRVGDFLLESLLSLVKLVFRDSVLLNKVITEPYKKEVVSYNIKGESTRRPTYKYDIKINLKYE